MTDVPAFDPLWAGPLGRLAFVLSPLLLLAAAGGVYRWCFPDREHWREVARSYERDVLALRAEVRAAADRVAREVADRQTDVSQLVRERDAARAAEAEAKAEAARALTERAEAARKWQDQQDFLIEQVDVLTGERDAARRQADLAAKLTADANAAAARAAADLDRARVDRDRLVARVVQLFETAAGEAHDIRDAVAAGRL